jgi:hypothetical protein
LPAFDNCGSPFPQGFFCQTPRDTCTKNADCNPSGGGDGQCSYDTKIGHWACRYDLACPG